MIGRVRAEPFLYRLALHVGALPIPTLDELRLHFTSTCIPNEVRSTHL